MSDDSEKSEVRSPEEEKAHLDALFKSWDSRRGDGLVLDADEAAEMAAARKAWGLDPSRVWRTIALLMMGLAVWVMTLIWADVNYWVQGDSSLLDVGHVGEMWAGGATDLEAPSNRYVSMEGLFVTLESEGERDTAKVGEREVVSRFFFCPLYDIAVRTQQPFPDKPVRRQWSLEIDGRYASLLEERRAFPVDLTVSVAVKGRLMRATDVPYWHSDPLIYYQQVSGISARKMWLVLDGSRPSDHRSSAILFGVALLIALSATYVGRSWLQARQA
jgi:hypothetical protein